MDWREVTIYTTTEGIGPVEALLEDNGVEGYVLEDAADFEEFLKDPIRPARHPHPPNEQTSQRPDA